MTNLMERAFALTMFVLSFTSLILSLIYIIDAETWKGVVFWTCILLCNGFGVLVFGLNYYFDFLEEKEDTYVACIEKLKYPALYGLILSLLFFLLNTAGH